MPVRYGLNTPTLTMQTGAMNSDGECVAFTLFRNNTATVEVLDIDSGRVISTSPDVARNVLPADCWPAFALYLLSEKHSDSSNPHERLF